MPLLMGFELAVHLPNLALLQALRMISTALCGDTQEQHTNAHT